MTKRATRNGDKKRRTPKDVKNEKNMVFTKAEKKEPRTPTENETRADNMVEVDAVCEIILGALNWVPIIEDELAEMNLRKVGRPFKYCRSMIAWMMLVAGYLNLNVRKTAGLARAVLGMAGVESPSYSQYFDRAMDMVGKVDQWGPGQRHILCMHAAMSGSDRVRRVGVDSTGLNLSSIFRYREHKWRTRAKYHGWLKLHALFDIDTGEMLAYVLTDETVGDSGMLPVLLDLADSAGYRMGECYADNAYAGKQNWIEVTRRRRMRFITAFRSNTNCKSEGCMEMGEAKRLWNSLPYDEWVRVSGYGVRWKVECGFSDLKRVTAEHVRARTHQGMVREVTGRIWSYNIHKRLRAEIMGVTGNGVTIVRGVWHGLSINPNSYRTEYSFQ